MRECVCPKCAANLTINDTNRDFAFCEFCGAKIMLDDYRMTQRIVDEAQLKRVEMEHEKFKELQLRRDEILTQWDAEQATEEAELANLKKGFIVLCCLFFTFFPLVIIPFYGLYYEQKRKDYEKKKKRREYMRFLPVDKFFCEMEVEWRNQRQ